MLIENYRIAFPVVPIDRSGEPLWSDRQAHAQWAQDKAHELNATLTAQPRGTPKSLLLIEKDDPKRIRVEVGSHDWTLFSIVKKGTTPAQLLGAFDDFVVPLGWTVVK